MSVAEVLRYEDQEAPVRRVAPAPQLRLVPPLAAADKNPAAQSFASGKAGKDAANGQAVNKHAARGQVARGQVARAHSEPEDSERGHAVRGYAVRRRVARGYVAPGHSVCGIADLERTVLAGMKAALYVFVAAVVLSMGLLIGSVFGVESGGAVTVQTGDTLSSIAAQIVDAPDHATALADLQRINGLSSEQLMPGQVLQIPAY